MKKLIRNKILVGGTVLALATMSVLGADNLGGDQSFNPGSGENYRANEFSVDVFGTASMGKYSIEHLSGTRVRHNTRLGAGAGVNYFFTRNLGIGGEVYGEDTKAALVDSASANVILRFPLGEGGFAPYVFGGAGYQFDFAQFTFAQLGAGMEYRFTPHIGLFVDARYVLPNHTQYYGVARLGLRFAF